MTITEIRKVGGFGGRKTRNPGNEVLYDLYVTQNLSARQIAEKYCVAEGTVRGWLYRANKELKEAETYGT